jgi:transcription-repair coupling factor (superfamily II helicase)
MGSTTEAFDSPAAAWAMRIAESINADQRSPTLVVVADEEAANLLIADLKVYAPSHTPRRYADDHQTPYARLTPDPAPGWGRLGLLAELALGDQPQLIVAEAAALGRRVPKMGAVADAALLLCEGDTVDRYAVVSGLEQAGYYRVNIVEDPGTVALRGSVIDVWPPALKQPVRVDLFGDQVEALRAFDPATQRQNDPLDLLVAGPARGYEVGARVAQDRRLDLAELNDQLKLPSQVFRDTMARLEAGIRYPGIEALAPVLRSGDTTLLNGLRADTQVVVCGPRQVRTTLDRRDQELLDGFNQRCGDELIAPPARHRMERRGVERSLRRFDAHHLLEDHAPERNGTARFSDLIDLRRDLLAASQQTGTAEVDLLAPFEGNVRRWRREGLAVVVLVRSEARRERLVQLLEGRRLGVSPLPANQDLAPPASLMALNDMGTHCFVGIGALQRGLIDRKRGLVVLPGQVLMGRRKRHANAKKKFFGTSLAELRLGDLVVHMDYGIGVYQGLVRRAIDGVQHDFLQVDFRGDDKVFVPVARIGVLRRYDGGGSPKLDRLGGTSWQKRTARLRQGLLAIAHDLVALQATRVAAQVAPLPDPGEMLAEFCDRFPFEPTPDQATCFTEVADDLASNQPMDRLVCGDVGFGKTEVALRASMIAAANGKQVVLLVPTTVLAQQHLRVFRERFAGFPVRVAGVSRLIPKSVQDKAREELKDGTLDIIIGTHVLLNDRFRFKDVGLLIIDEEQRFGVGHKEKIKRLRHDINVLTLTATPIPRTLQLSLFGVRELSIIETPPVDRRSVRTALVPYDERMIKEVINRETDRGGQVFFLHNNVGNLPEIAARLRRIVPQASVGIAHGQMPAAAVDQALLDFVAGQTNVLVCTTIIESGIDIPNANTILIDRADRFGLTQLYQIRGRVGRRQARAFCYLLLHKSEDALSETARLRLDALRRFTELGSGFKIAREDLDIRGAGNLVGADQSGHIEAVGFDLYAELLAEALAKVRGGTHQSLGSVTVKVGRTAAIPHAYMPDASERVGLYDRFSSLPDDDSIDALEDELVDRYGSLPQEIDALVATARCRWRAAAFGASEVVVSQAPGSRPNAPAYVVAVTFDPDRVRIDAGAITQWLSGKTDTNLSPTGRVIWRPKQEPNANCADDPAVLALELCTQLAALTPR